MSYHRFSGMTAAKTGLDELLSFFCGMTNAFNSCRRRLAHHGASTRRAFVRPFAKIFCPSRSSVFVSGRLPKLLTADFLKASAAVHCPHRSRTNSERFPDDSPKLLIRCIPDHLDLCRLSTWQPNEKQTGDASPWCWELLCRDVATSSPQGSVAFRMLPSLASDDLALLALYLVKTKRAVREDGVLKVITGSGGGGGGDSRGALAISETDRDLLRLRSSSSDI